MATLYIPKGRKTFYISYRVNGKNIRRNTYLTEDQKEKATELKKELEKNLQAIQLKPVLKSRESNIGNLAISDAINEFIACFKINWSKGRMNNVITTLKIFYDELSGIKFVTDITSNEISDFIASRREKVSITTVRSDLNVLRTFFNYLLDENKIFKSPINKKLIPKPIHKSITTFDKQSIDVIMESLKLSDQKFYKYLFLLNATGARPGDILRLKYGDIDLINEEIRIKIQKTSREVIFPLYNALKDFITAEFSDINKINPEENIFKEYNIPKVGKKFKKLKTELGLNKSFNLKTFRKTFATRLADENIDGHVIAYLLAHTSVNTTSKYYISKKVKNIKNSLNNMKILM